MSTGTSSKTRSDRVAAIGVPPGPWSRVLTRLRSRPALIRLGICMAAALAMWAQTSAWKPPFGYRAGDVPPRAITARVAFSRADPEKFAQLRAQKRREAVLVYENNSKLLAQSRQGLANQVLEVLSGESMKPEVWRQFRPTAAADQSDPLAEEAYLAFRAALDSDENRTKFFKAIDEAMQPLERQGLIDSVHAIERGNQSTIMVHPFGDPTQRHPIDLTVVQRAKAMSQLRDRLNEALQAAFDDAADQAALSEAAYNWLAGRKLPATLTINEEASNEARRLAEQRVVMPTEPFNVGAPLADGGEALTKEDIDLLKLEHQALVSQLTWGQQLRYTLANWGMYAALYILCGVYINYHVPRLFRGYKAFISLMALAVATVGLCVLASHQQWRAELVPLTLFAMTIAITRQRELALLLATCLALVVTFSGGRSLADFVILVASVGAAVLPATRIRSRTKLIYVGLGAAMVAALTTLGVGTLTGQPFSSGDFDAWPEWLPAPSAGVGFAALLMQGAAWHGFCMVLAGLLITGLLPFIERLLDVQTDISLLELGDAAHPLLQELARRALGTYNHSINVASLSEAAAEAIGANGLLARVGAYFHDIGKMLKPNYFVENQGQDPSSHETLMPAMSTLVIIAHVKDGADLGRQHGLPQAIIDFIEQHHGTTLVEYFYRQAAQRSEDSPDQESVDETNFRYPGPKPQTKEAAVMMLADACESASRALVDPAPSRIEHLVNELAMKRLLDGQFDQCQLTLQELALIKDSLAKSLTAVYHGRVKYPDQQQTA